MVDKLMPVSRLRCKHCGAEVAEFDVQVSLYDDYDYDRDIRQAPNFSLAFDCGRKVERDPDYPNDFETSPCGG